jgi:hypothetical protein
VVNAGRAPEPRLAAQARLGKVIKVAIQSLVRGLLQAAVAPERPVLVLQSPALVAKVVTDYNGLTVLFMLVVVVVVVTRQQTMVELALVVAELRV